MKSIFFISLLIISLPKTAFGLNFYFEGNVIRTKYLSNSYVSENYPDCEFVKNFKKKSIRKYQTNDQYIRPGIYYCGKIGGEIKMMTTIEGHEQAFCFFGEKEFIDINGLARLIEEEDQ